MSAFRNLAGQTAIALVASSALLFACNSTSEPSIIGRWVPADVFSKERGASQAYRGDSTFVLRVSSEAAPLNGRFSIRRDSLFTFFSAIDSTFLVANALPAELFVEEGSALVGEFRLTWSGSDTLIMESGQGPYSAHSILVRDLSVHSTP